MIDEWSGFADLLANLIEKYVSELDVENLPAPAVSFDNQDSAANKKDSDFNAESVESKIAARSEEHDINVQTRGLVYSLSSWNIKTESDGSVNKWRKIK